MPGAAARNNTPRPLPLYAYRTNAPSYMADLYAWPPTPLTNPTVAVSPYGPHSYPLFVSSAAHGLLGPPSLPHMVTSNALPPHPHRMPYERPCRGSVLTPDGQSVAAPTGYPARSPHSVPELPFQQRPAAQQANCRRSPSSFAKITDGRSSYRHMVLSAVAQICGSRRFAVRHSTLAL
ncbi:hypothetical protein MYU51_019611 [Penicillium brevicompactum]